MRCFGVYELFYIFLCYNNFILLVTLMFKTKVNTEVLEKIRDGIRTTTPKEIAGKVGLHPETVSKIARLYFNYKGKRNNPNPRRDIDISLIKSMRGLGLSYRHIAKNLNISHMAVYNRLKEQEINGLRMQSGI